MPRESGSAKTYCTLREAFDLVGASVYGPKWRGFEADCDPAREKEQTDSKTLLRKLAPDGRSFSTKEKDRRPVPKRPIDDKHGVRFGRAIGRHIKALKELLRLLHGGHLPAKFIPESETTVRDGITASDWPDPEKFNPRKPSWRNLWFDVGANRVVLKSPGTPATSGRGRDYGDLWWAYGRRAGHVEIDREALERALRPPVEDKGIGLSREDQKKGGSRRTYDKGLQQFINRLAVEFKDAKNLLTPPTLKAWLERNANLGEGYDPTPEILDCDDIEFNGSELLWKDHTASQKSMAIKSVDRYIQRANNPNLTSAA